MQTERENGKPRASIHDLHSFRVTWTITPAGGVPLDLVQRVTSHPTVEVVMKHYFRTHGGPTCGRYTAEEKALD